MNHTDPSKIVFYLYLILLCSIFVFYSMHFSAVILVFNAFNREIPMHPYTLGDTMPGFHTERDVPSKSLEIIVLASPPWPPYPHGSNRAPFRLVSHHSTCLLFLWLLARKGPFNEIVLSIWSRVQRAYRNEQDSHRPCSPEALRMVGKTNAEQGHCMNFHLITVVNKCSKETYRG